MESVYEWLSLRCKTAARELVPDLVFDCWVLRDTGMCQEAICLWDCLVSELGVETGRQVRELLECMHAATLSDFTVIERLIESREYLKSEDELRRLVVLAKPQVKPDPISPTFTVMGLRYTSLTESSRKYVQMRDSQRPSEGDGGAGFQ